MTPNPTARRLGKSRRSFEAALSDVVRPPTPTRSRAHGAMTHHLAERFDARGQAAPAPSPNRIMAAPKPCIGRRPMPRLGGISASPLYRGASTVPLQRMPAQLLTPTPARP